MNKQNIKDQLNQNRNKVLIKDSSPDINILATIKVAKQGSKVFDESLAVFERAGRFYTKEYSHKNLPSSVLGAVEIPEKDKDILCQVIGSYEDYKHYHLNPYTFLVTGCLQHDLDILLEGILEL